MQFSSSVFLSLSHLIKGARVEITYLMGRYHSVTICI